MAKFKGPTGPTLISRYSVHRHSGNVKNSYDLRNLSVRRSAEGPGGTEGFLQRVREALQFLESEVREVQNKKEDIYLYINICMIHNYICTYILNIYIFIHT